MPKFKNIKMFRNIELKTFYRFLFLFVFSSSLVFLLSPELCDLEGVLTLIGLAVLCSSAICLVSYCLRKYKFLKQCFEWICISIILLIILVDVFLYVNFGILIDETVFNIIEGTNAEESADFLLTYFNAKTIIALIGVLGFCALILWGVPWILGILPSIISKVCISFFILFSIIKICWAVYSSLTFGFGGHLAAYSSFSRIARSCYIYWSISNETNLLIENLKNFGPGELKMDRCDKMVVIIGESYSKYHSQLYGYDKETSPLLTERASSGDLVVYTDVITPINDTERSFRAVYSLGEYYNDVYFDYTLFPYVFKQAGFYTVNIDNLDLASKTSRVKDSRRLSRLMFDFRNETTCQYDEGIISWLDIGETLYPKQLFVIKLRGQHYDYENQFPDTFVKYKSSDYPNVDYPENKKQIVADYDNATIYNDYVVDSIINYFEDDNAVVLYFSDHGEEVYDERDYMGHGGTTPYLNYQVEIPFMIWMSESYRDSNPSVVENIIANKDLPYTTDDVSHTILDMTGISCSQFVPERSLANDVFDSSKSRVVMKSLIYDNR